MTDKHFPVRRQVQQEPLATLQVQTAITRLQGE